MGMAANIVKMGLDLTAGNEKAAGDYQDAKENQALAESAAADAIARGNREASLRAMKGTQQQSAQKVGYTDAGVDTQAGGTVEQAAGQTGYFSELDQKTTQLNAAREAWGFRTQAQRFSRAADKTVTDNNLRIGSTILGTLGKLGGGG
jgi:hypothetical protein